VRRRRSPEARRPPDARLRRTNGPWRRERSGVSGDRTRSRTAALANGRAFGGTGRGSTGTHRRPPRPRPRRTERLRSSIDLRFRRRRRPSDSVVPFGHDAYRRGRGPSVRATRAGHGSSRLPGPEPLRIGTAAARRSTRRYGKRRPSGPGRSRGRGDVDPALRRGVEPAARYRAGSRRRCPDSVWRRSPATDRRFSLTV